MTISEIHSHISRRTSPVFLFIWIILYSPFNVLGGAEADVGRLVITADKQIIIG